MTNIVGAMALFGDCLFWSAQQVSGEFVFHIFQKLPKLPLLAYEWLWGKSEDPFWRFFRKPCIWDVEQTTGRLGLRSPRTIHFFNRKLRFREKNLI